MTEPPVLSAATPAAPSPLGMDAEAENRLARHNALVLSVAQAIVGSAQPIMVTLGGVAGFYLLGEDKSLATVPVTGMLVGVAIGAWPAALLMRRIGRKPGFLVGTLFGATGGLLSAYAVYIGLFWLLVMAASLNGIAASFLQQYRFAAADVGDTARRAKSISWVLAGGIAAAVIGPQTVIATRDLFDPIPFVGGYLAITGLAIAGAVILLFLKDTGFQRRHRVGSSGGRSLFAIVTQPRFAAALICAAGAYGVMSLVMTAAPLAMVAHNHSHDSAALGVQWHVIAMFAPSFVTGSLIARYGAERVIAGGMAMLLLAAITALLGPSLFNFWGALILLGTGWNFGFIGATTMLTRAYRPEEAGRAQGFNDFVVFAVTGVASFASGKMLNAAGWDSLSWLSFPIIGVCLLALALLMLQKPSPETGPLPAAE